MTIKSQKLLPSSEIRASKQTISTSLLRDLKPEKPIKIDNVSKESSLAEKFGVIFKFLNKEYKRDRMSWFRERKRKQEERRKKREEELEKNKGKSKIGKGISAVLPLKNIFDNISNFLLFLAGGFLLNKILDILPQLMEIGKILKPITIGIYNFGKFMFGTVIGFIDAGYAIHDDLRSKVEELGGKDAVDKFDKFAKQFKKVINGAIILAMLSTLLPKKRRGGDRKADCKPCQPCICREPQTAPVRVFEPVRIRSISGATEGGYNFDWAKIFERLRDPIRNLVRGRQPGGVIVNQGALQEEDSQVVGGLVTASETQTATDAAGAYATYSLTEARTAYDQTRDLILAFNKSIADPNSSQEDVAKDTTALAQLLLQATQIENRIKQLDSTWEPPPPNTSWVTSQAQITRLDEAYDAIKIIMGNIDEATLPIRQVMTFIQFIQNGFIQWGIQQLFGGKAVAGTLNENRSQIIASLGVFPSYNYQENLMIFNKTFIQDRYIIG